MTRGYPDYQQPTNIVAQDLTQVSTDVVAQSVGNIATEIAAQTLDELDINIKNQTLGSVAMDIAAQSVGNVGTDIAAQSVGNLAVDVATQTLDKIDIDITGQTIGSVAMNIKGQTIAEVIQRPKQGTPHGKISTGTAPPNAYQPVVSVSGKGVVYWGWIKVNAGSGVEALEPTFRCDGNEIVFDRSYEWYNDNGFPSSGLPITLVDYAVGGPCTAFIQTPTGLTFESSVDIGLYNTTGTDTTFVGYLAYAIL